MKRKDNIPRARSCLYGLENIVCIYMTSCGYYKVTDSDYSVDTHNAVCQEVRGQYMIFNITEDEYMKIRMHMYKMKVHQLGFDELIDNMGKDTSRIDSHTRKILDFVIFPESVSEPKTEEQFINRLFMEFL